MLTNKFNLPEEVCMALGKNRYSGDTGELKSDYSATTIIAPVQQTILKKRHPDSSSEDYMDRVWSMFGSIAHVLLEEHGSEGADIETRYFTTVLGKTISGQIDHYKNKVVTDYKTTSAYKVQKGDLREWAEQLNVYAYLCRENGLQVDSVRIIAIIRDWSELESLKGNGYPSAPIQIIDIPLWDEHKQAIFISEKIKHLKINEQLKDSELDHCTNEEMWADEPKWAVYKTLDSKRATRVLHTEQEAIDFNGGHIVKRLGQRRRCMRYCPVSNSCSQYAAYLKEQSGEVIF